MATEKIYTIKIEASQAQQALDTAVKQFNELKAKAAAANQEQRESKAVYQENATALKELVQQQKALEAAKRTASPGASAMGAGAALDKNLAQQKQLNSIVQESKIVYQDAKAAAEAAGAAVSKQAGSVKELQASVKAYGAAAAEAALTFAPGTIGALRTEIAQLKTDLNQLTEGSAEAAAAIQQIGEKESQLRKLANALNATNPERQARAFTVLNQALVGVVGISLTAAQAFGLSEANAQKYAQRMQALTGVLYSVESVSKLLNGENLSLVKSIYSGAKAWLFAGESATVAGRATRTAIASTGIGLLVLAVGALISLFVDLGSTVKGSESTFTKYKAAVVGVFDGLIAVVKDYFTFLYQLATFDFSGAIKTAQGAGKDIAEAYTKGRAGVIDEARRAELAHEAEKTARYISIIQSRGEDTLALEVANAKRLIDAQKEGSKEQLDAVRDYLVLKNQLLKRQADEEKAQALARLEGLAAIDAAAGKAVIERQRAVLQERLQQQLDADELAGRGQSAATIKLLTEIQATEEAFEKETREKRQAAELAALDARISLRKAKGQEAFAQEVARAEQELQFLKSAAQRGEAAIMAAQAQRNDLVAAHAYELTQRRHALKLAELDAIISLENTKGEDSFEQQVAREERALTYQKQLGTRNLAAEVAQQSKIDNLKAAHALKVDADERAADLARLNARIAYLQVQGEDTTQLQLNLKAKELTTLLGAATQNAAAIIAKQGEIDALIEQQRITTAEKRRARLIEDFEGDMTVLEKQGKDTLALRVKFARAQVALDTDTSEKGLAQRRADVQKLRELEAELSQRGPDIGGALLKLIGIKEEDLPKAKQALADFYQSAGLLANAFLDAATQQTEQALAAAQAQLQTATEQLAQAQSAADATASKLEGSEGAARDYYLQRLAKERAEVERLAAQKAKAAAEEKKQQQEQHKLQKIGLELSAAATLAANVAAAANAVAAGVKAVSGAAALPFPASLPAIVAAVAAVGAAIASAKQLATATKFEAGTGALGADGVLRGPRHAQGGIPFTVGGRPGFEAEGGEAITPVDATQRNGALLALIRTQGRSRTIGPLDMLRLAGNAQAAATAIVPTPKAYYETGGILNKGGTPGGQVSSQDMAAVTVRLDQQNGALLQIAARLDNIAESSAATQAHTRQAAASNQALVDFGPPRIVRSHQEVLDDEQLLKEAKQAKSDASL
jgi:hypothetical protein